MLRIALTGAHGTGKTTLVTALPERLAGSGKISVCREAPRVITEIVADPEFFRRGNNTPLRQSAIFLQHLLEERRESRSCDLLITDRTLVDHLAYSATLFPELQSGPEFDVYKRVAFESLEDYDVIFKLPIEFAAKDDGVREADAAFQSSIDSAIDQFYEEAKVVPVVLRGSVEQRLSDAIAAIAR